MWTGVRGTDSLPSCLAEVALQKCLYVVFITYWYTENIFQRTISLHFRVSKPSFCTINSIILENFYINWIVWSLNLTAVFCKRESSAFVESFKKILGFNITLFLLDVLAFGVIFSCQGFCYLLDKPFIGIFPKSKESIHLFHIPVTF